MRVTVKSTLTAIGMCVLASAMGPVLSDIDEPAETPSSYAPAVAPVFVSLDHFDGPPAGQTHFAVYRPGADGTTMAQPGIARSGTARQFLPYE